MRVIKELLAVSIWVFLCLLQFLIEWILWRAWFISDYWIDLFEFHIEWWQKANAFRRQYP